MDGNAHEIKRYVRNLNGEYFLQAEVAAALQCSIGLLIKVREEDPQELGPSFGAPWHAEIISLYTLEDVARLRKHFATRWPERFTDPSPGQPAIAGKSKNPAGRPAVFQRSERRERQNRHSKAGYWAAQARKYTAAGRDELALSAQQKCDAIRAVLRAEHDARNANRTPNRTENRDINLVVG